MSMAAGSTPPPRPLAVSQVVRWFCCHRQLEWTKNSLRFFCRPAMVCAVWEYREVSGLEICPTPRISQMVMARPRLRGK